MSAVQTVPPSQWPVTLDALKLRVRVTHSDMDPTLIDYIRAATDYAQEYQWAQYCTATFVERFDCFPCVIKPHWNPVQSVTSLAYLDTAGSSQTLVQNTDYTVDIYSKPARVVPAYGKSWPLTRRVPNAITLTYVAGYGEPSDVPDLVRHAILLKAAQQYEECHGKGMSADDSIHALLDKNSFRVFF